MLQKKPILPTIEQALTGRQDAIQIPNSHYVHGRPIAAPFSEADTEVSKIMFGLGCFWGAERAFWSLPGVFTTAVGYGGGLTPNPTYQEVCSGSTAHNELVLVVYRPSEIDLRSLLKVFFESHNPTQGMRQGNDVGTQYRSGIYFLHDQHDSADYRLAEQSLSTYQGQLTDAGVTEEITTELQIINDFYYAEEYHQQYLAKNPNGYCGLGGIGINCNLAAG